MTKARDNADNWAADITGVTAGTGITGGGTSGTVTVTADLSTSVASTSTTQAATPSAVKEAYDLANAAIPASIVDAKGDLVVASAADTVIRVPVGTNNQLLTADSSTTSGVKWADAPASGGFVLLSTQTVPTNGTSVTFSSIPSTYKHLFFRFSGIATNANDVQLKATWNNNSSYYAYNTYSGNGNLSDTGPVIVLTGTQTGNGTMWIYNYAQSNNVYPSWEAKSTAIASGTIRWVHTFGGADSFNANINTVTFTVNTSSFFAGKILLYGVN